MNRNLFLTLGAVLCLNTIGLVGCATLPPGRSVSALYVDVRRSVELREEAEWVIDRLAIEAIAPTVMRSTCQVDDTARLALKEWVQQQIALHGGPAESMLARDPSADIDRVLTLERIAAVLSYAEAHATECPFWLRPVREFDGIQSDAYRLVVLAESVGGGGAIISGGKVGLGGGGAVRVSLAVGLDQRYTIALGAESGGIATFTQSDASGGRTLVGRYSTAIPLVLRIKHDSRLIDLELAATARWSDSSLRIPPGIRAAIGYGLSTVRVGAFMPTATVRVSFEVLPQSNDGLPPEYLLFLGTNVGLDIDP